MRQFAISHGMVSTFQHRCSLAFACLAFSLAIGCSPLSPKTIDATRLYESPMLASGEPQIQRGQPRKILDGVGWVFGIPSKILLWDRRIENHRIGPDTEKAIDEYLRANQLSTVRVRLNQYRPGEDWHRLVANKSVGAPWRYTLGTLSVLGETIIPGRVFGGDHYNPFTNTVHVYSDVPSIALHEGGHAKDFARRKWKGSYAFTYLLPVVPLYHESIASRDVIAYLEAQGDPLLQAESRRILYPAYGTYVGSAAGYAWPRYSNPIYYGSVIAGHAIGRTQARQFSQESSQSPMGDTASNAAGNTAFQPHAADAEDGAQEIDVQNHDPSVAASMIQYPVPKK